MSPRQILDLIKQDNIEFIDCRFMDFPGQWQHTTYPADQLTLESFTHGFGFDGSSLRGWQALNESDMILVPVAETARFDPFFAHPTLSMICDIKDPVTKKQYARDPRSIARKATAYLESTGIADTACFGPELEFFILDNASFEQGTNHAHYRVDSSEGIWNRGSQHPANLGEQIRPREGSYPIPPGDRLADIRSEMVKTMKDMNISVASHHHEVATGGQVEIDLNYQSLMDMADSCMYFKYIAKCVAARHGKVATFMPKPLFGDNGSGMHTHFSLWKKNKPIMAGRKYAGLSDVGLWVIGGILKHARALTAFTNPTTNSFKRLVPGFEAPINLVYSSRNRSAAIRIPVYQSNPNTKRIELRCPDSSCNPYLAFSAILMAAIDGVQNKIDPGQPLDKNLYELEPEEYETIDTTPATLDEALNALEEDHDFLLAGDVFSSEVIHYWIRYKRDNEVAAIQARPHPYEFCMYFDI